MVIRVWDVDGERQGRVVEQRRPAVGEPWRTVTGNRLSPADLAGRSTDPARTIRSLPGFLTFDAQTLDIEDNGGLAFTLVAAADRRFIIRFGARDERSGNWSTVTRFVGR